MRSPSAIIKGWNLFKNDEENIRSSFNALKVITSEHERIHNGKMFAYSHVDSLAPGASEIIYFNVSSDEALHLRNVVYQIDVGPCEGYLYEEPYIDVASLGEGFRPINLNRESSYVSPSSFYHGTYLDANSLGEQIGSGAIVQATGGAVKSIAGEAESAVTEWVLARGKKYAFEFTNNNAGTGLLSGSFTIYEP